MKKNIIKLFDPVIGNNEKKAVDRVLKSGYWASGSGEGDVKKFEKLFLDYTNAKSCIAVNNGTSALHLALSLYDIRGKEVILPSITFVSTAHAIIYNGGIPIFAEINPTTLCIDVDDVTKKITKKTKIILPVHFGGMACDMKKLKKISTEYKIKLVEDAAHATGTKFCDSKIGSIGDATCFSFHPVKNLAMPTGGAITLNGKNSKEFEKILKSRRWCGIENRKASKYEINELGWNFYMNEFSAAIGIEQLKKIEKLNNKRRKIARRYFNSIQTNEKMPFLETCSYHLYWIQVKKRDKFMKKMLDEGIQTGIHYNPVHKMNFYDKKQKLSISEKVGDTIVSLPIHPNLSDKDVEKIIKTTNRLL